MMYRRGNPTFYLPSSTFQPIADSSFIRAGKNIRLQNISVLKNQISEFKVFHSKQEPEERVVVGKSCCIWTQVLPKGCRNPGQCPDLCEKKSHNRCCDAAEKAE